MYTHTHTYVHTHTYINRTSSAFRVNAVSLRKAPRINSWVDPRTEQTFPSVSFHRCRCVSVKCVERAEAVLGVWLPAPLPTPRALPDHGAIWPLAVGVEKDWAVSMFDLAV